MLGKKSRSADPETSSYFLQILFYEVAVQHINHFPMVSALPLSKALGSSFLSTNGIIISMWVHTWHNGYPLHQARFHVRN